MSAALTQQYLLAERDISTAYTNSISEGRSVHSAWYSKLELSHIPPYKSVTYIPPSDDDKLDYLLKIPWITPCVEDLSKPSMKIKSPETLGSVTTGGKKSDTPKDKASTDKVSTDKKDKTSTDKKDKASIVVDGVRLSSGLGYRSNSYVKDGHISYFLHSTTDEYTQKRTEEGELVKAKDMPRYAIYDLLINYDILSTDVGYQDTHRSIDGHLEYTIAHMSISSSGGNPSERLPKAGMVDTAPSEGTCVDKIRKALSYMKGTIYKDEITYSYQDIYDRIEVLYELFSGSVLLDKKVVSVPKKESTDKKDVSVPKKESTDKKYTHIKIGLGSARAYEDLLKMTVSTKDLFYRALVFHRSPSGISKKEMDILYATDAADMKKVRAIEKMVHDMRTMLYTVEETKDEEVLKAYKKLAGEFLRQVDIVDGWYVDKEYGIPVACTHFFDRKKGIFPLEKYVIYKGRDAICKICGEILPSSVADSENRNLASDIQEVSTFEDTVATIIKRLMASQSILTNAEYDDVLKNILWLLTTPLKYEEKKIKSTSITDRSMRREFIALGGVISIIYALSTRKALTIDEKVLAHTIVSHYTDMMKKFGFTVEGSITQMKSYWDMSLSKYYDNPKERLDAVVSNLLKEDITESKLSVAWEKWNYIFGMSLTDKGKKKPYKDLSPEDVKTGPSFDWARRLVEYNKTGKEEIYDLIYREADGKRADRAYHMPYDGKFSIDTNKSSKMQVYKKAEINVREAFDREIINICPETVGGHEWKDSNKKIGGSIEIDGHMDSSHQSVERKVSGDDTDLSHQSVEGGSDHIDSSHQSVEGTPDTVSSHQLGGSTDKHKDIHIDKHKDTHDKVSPTTRCYKCGIEREISSVKPIVTDAYYKKYSKFISEFWLFPSRTVEGGTFEGIPPVNMRKPDLSSKANTKYPIPTGLENTSEMIAIAKAMAMPELVEGIKTGDTKYIHALIKAMLEKKDDPWISMAISSLYG